MVLVLMPLGARAEDDDFAVTSVDPNTFSTAGGDTLSIEGMGLWLTDRVLLGDVECLHVLAVSDQRLQCETPAVDDAVPRYAPLNVTLVRGNASAVGVGLITWRVPRSRGNGGIALLIGLAAFTLSMMATFTVFTCVRNYYHSKGLHVRRPQVLELGLTPRGGLGRRPSHTAENNHYRKDAPGVVARGGHVTVAAVNRGEYVQPVRAPAAAVHAAAGPTTGEPRGVSWDLSPPDSGQPSAAPLPLARALGGVTSMDSLTSEDAVVSNVDSTQRRSWFSRVLRPKPSRMAIRDSSDMHALEREHAAQRAAADAAEDECEDEGPAQLPPPANVGWWSAHSPRWHSPRDRERKALKVPQGLLLRVPSFMEDVGGAVPESHLSTLRAAGVGVNARDVVATPCGSVHEAVPDALAVSDPAGKVVPTPREEEHMWVFYGKVKDALRTPRRFRRKKKDAGEPRQPRRTGTRE